MEPLAQELQRAGSVSRTRPKVDFADLMQGTLTGYDDVVKPLESRQARFLS